MCTGHDSSSVHPKEGERRKKETKQTKERREEGRKENVQEKTAEDVKNDGGKGEKQRDNRTLLRHRKRKHVTPSQTNGVTSGSRG